MAKKRANGEGSIRKRSDGRWEGRYTAGYYILLFPFLWSRQDLCANLFAGSG